MEDKIKIREMQRADISQAAEVLGKAYATNPAFLAIYQGKPKIARRVQILFTGTFKYGMGICFLAAHNPAS